MPLKQEITLFLNSHEVKYSDSLNIAKLLEKQGYADKKIAVAVNGQFIPRSAYEDHILKGGDDVEVVAPMQGG